MAVKVIKGFELWSHLGLDDRLDLYKPRNMPFITYPNGMPCYEANMYMRHLAEKGCKDTTLKGYANTIIHLVRFIENTPDIRYFSQLTNATFRLFIQNLQAERRPNGERYRENNTVIEIGKRCLDFLSFIQEFHDLYLFIGTVKSNTIVVQKQTHSIAMEDSKHKKEVTSFTHNCLPTKDAVKKRFPVSKEAALQVWTFVQNQTDRAKRFRDIALYQLMEQSGGRVKELHLITVDDYEEAKKMSEPSIRMHTLKRRDEKVTRYVPIPRTVMTDIGQYMKYRRNILKKKKLTDHGFLFISTTTGQQFKADSWTTYLNKWKKELNIEGALHPHLYRHAFITNKLKEIILAHQSINNSDDFRKHLLHTETFKLQLQQWTGHTNTHSLDTYIHLAFAEINNYTETYNAAALNSSVKVIKYQLSRVKSQIRNNELTLTEAILKLDGMVEAFEDDIERCCRKV